ncbi:MAG TPA: SycD/LcrH family type III secretion system chaperone [Parachlamydiaceae bacterium]|nr:SycD/LcrH family type III secretion system chaperone [Parachlamydiaceae bacterium]
MTLETAESEKLGQITDFLNGMTSENGNALSQLSPDSLSALYSMGYQLYRNGKYEDAKCFFRFLTLNNSFERKYWMGLGACYQMLKLYNEAIECYSAAAIQDPTDPYVHLHAADCYFHMHNLAKAKEALESAMITAKDDKAYEGLIPKLQLISDTWSNLPNGVSHD